MINSPAGHLYFRLDIILVKGLTKHTLKTYFSGMKIDPKYAFLHAFFLIGPSCPYQNLSLCPKTHPFFPIFLITWIFLRGWYPTSNTSAPLGLIVHVIFAVTSTCSASCLRNYACGTSMRACMYASMFKLRTCLMVVTAKIKWTLLLRQRRLTVY